MGSIAARDDVMTQVTWKHLIRLVYPFRGFVHYHDRKHGSREHGAGKVASSLMMKHSTR